jgi:hypothetical protein
MENITSRYDTGFVDYSHKGKTIRSSVGNSIQDNFSQDPSKSYDFQIGVIPVGYEHRPDLISNVFYGTPNFWWLILSYNNINDPFEGLNVGDTILIPKI